MRKYIMAGMMSVLGGISALAETNPAFETAAEDLAEAAEGYVSAILPIVGRGVIAILAIFAIWAVYKIVRRVLSSAG
jgi:hypothetical protein